MLNTTNSNSEYLHNYIRKVAKQEQESVDTSNVYTGTIEAAQSGIYTIVLNQSDKSSSVLAIPIVTGDVYDKDDSVYLLRANTTATVNYFIVGKVNAIQEAFFNLTELERFNPNESKVDLVFENGNEIDIKDNESNIFDNIRNLGYFQLEMKITSKVEDNDKINIYLNYISESQYEAKFVFSSYEFIGQPGGDSYTLIQKKIFHLPSNIDIKNIRIEKVGDFSVGAMNIVAGSLLEVSAAYQNNIIVQNDRNYFEKEMPDVSNPLNTVTLTSKIYYNNKPLVGDTLQYYWFLKDDNAIDSESVDYVNIEGAGNGWRCLNTLTLATTADGQEIRLWDNKNNFITLNKKHFIVPNDLNEFVNFSNFVNKVKCIVKYFDNFIESDLIDIYNYDYEQFSTTLTASVDPIVIINREDAILLECKVANNNSKIDLNNFVYKYEWHLGNTILSNLKDGLIKIQDKSSTTLKEEDIQDNIREMENDIEEYYCKVSIYHKNDVIDGEVIEGKQPISEEISNTIQVTSAAAATDIQEEVQYKYYIADNHRVTFEENVQDSEDTELSKWSGDWDIYDNNVTNPIWTDGSFEVVFNDLNLFSNKDETKEYFVYYTKRTIVRQGLEILRKETGSFPQIARSVIYLNGWRNHRIEDSINQLNTFNQLTKNGEDDGIYYAEIPELVKGNSTPVWGTIYYKRIATDSNIKYEPITLTETISFKATETYYVLNKDGSYSMVAKSEKYNSNTDYYKKINDTEYQKLVVNTQNFDITVAWPDDETGPFYENIDNRLFINATYIKSGTLEVNNKFYASIDQDDVKIAGFNVNEATLESKNGTVGLNSDNSDSNNIAIWAGIENGIEHSFQVTHDGKLKATDAEVKGRIIATELYIGESPDDFATTYQDDKDKTAQEIKEVLNTANTAISDARQAKQGAASALKTATNNTKDINELGETVKTLSSDTLPATYLKVVPEGSDSNMPNGYIAIKSKDDKDNPTDNPGMIFFNTNELIINSDNLKLNHDGDKYSEDYFEIDTDPLKLKTIKKVDSDEYSYSLAIDTDNFKLQDNTLTMKNGIIQNDSYSSTPLEKTIPWNTYLELLTKLDHNEQIDGYWYTLPTFLNKDGEYAPGYYDMTNLDHLSKIWSTKAEYNKYQYFAYITCISYNGELNIIKPEIDLNGYTVSFDLQKEIENNSDNYKLYNYKITVVPKEGENKFYSEKRLDLLNKHTYVNSVFPLLVKGAAISLGDPTNGTFIHFPHFQVDKRGNLFATNATLSGSISATAGTIGGFHIAKDHLADGEPNSDGSTDDHSVMLSPGLKKNEGDDAGYVFWAGRRKPEGDDSSRPFWIKNDGSFNSTKGTIGGWQINETFFSNLQQTVGLSSGTGGAAFWAGNETARKAPFYVSITGDLKATSAVFDNKISVVAERGNVAGTVDTVDISSTAIRIYQVPSESAEIVWMTEITPMGIINGTKKKTNIGDSSSEWETKSGATGNVTVVTEVPLVGQEETIKLCFVNGLFIGTA